MVQNDERSSEIYPENPDLSVRMFEDEILFWSRVDVPFVFCIANTNHSLVSYFQDNTWSEETIWANGVKVRFAQEDGVDT